MLKLVALVCDAQENGGGCLLSLQHIVDWISLFIVDLDGISLEHSVNQFRSIGLLACQLGGDRACKQHALEDLQSALALAVASNKLQFVQMLCGYLRGTCRFSSANCVETASNALIGAATNGFMPIVEFLWRFLTSRQLSELACQDLFVSQTRDALVQAASHGHMQVIKFLCEATSRSFSKNTVSASTMQQAAQMAACHGHLPVVDYLSTYRNYPSIKCTDCVMEQALANGHLPVVIFMDVNFCGGLKGSKNDCECQQQHLWQQGIQSGLLQRDALLDQLATNGDVELIQWLLRRYPRLELHGKLLSFVAKAGKLSLLQWLVSHPSCKLDGDQILKSNRLYPFAHLALQTACSQGHVSVVQFLLDCVGDACELSAGCVDAAVLNGRLELVQFLFRACEHHWNVSISSDALDQAFVSGHITLIKWLTHQNHHDFTIKWLSTLMSTLHHCGHHNALTFASTCSCSGCSVWSKAIDRAAQVGNVELLEFCGERMSTFTNRQLEKKISLTPTWWLIPALCEAIGHGQLSVVKLLFPQVAGNRCNGLIVDALNQATRWDPSCSSSSSSVIASSSTRWHRLRRILKFLLPRMTRAVTTSKHEDHEEEPFLDLTQVIQKAIQENDLTVLRLCHECCVQGFSVQSIDEAAFHGHLRIVRFLHDHRTEGCTSDAMNHASSRGFLSIVQFLHAKRHEGCTPKAMDDACFKGHLHVVQFLHAHRHEGCSTNAMDDAAASGNMQIVRFLHEHCQEGCTTRAMNRAAAAGHLQMVQFLHEFREEGCTTDAMDDAARNGHFEIVRFLHTTRQEGCTSRAMDDAACQGHLQIVQYLHAHRHEGCTSKAMDGAAAKGFVDIVKFLHWNRTEGCSPRAIELASQKCHSRVVRFLLLYRVDTTCQSVLKAACESGQLAIVRLVVDMKAANQEEQEEQEQGTQYHHPDTCVCTSCRRVAPNSSNITTTSENFKWHCDFREYVRITERSVFCWDRVAKAQIIAVLEQQVGLPPAKRRRLP